MYKSCQNIYTIVRFTKTRAFVYQSCQNISKGGIISEKSEGFLHLQLSKKNTPKHYPKLLHPVHGNDKILIGFDILQIKKYSNYEM